MVNATSQTRPALQAATTPREPINGRKVLARLHSKRSVAANVIELTLVLPDTVCLQVQPFQHIKAYAKVGTGRAPSECQILGRVVARSYTPTSSDDASGVFTLCVKVYPLTLGGPETRGAMSRYLFGLKPGQHLEICGRFGKNTYNRRGSWTIRRGLADVKIDRVPVINLIAGGSGLTPMIQAILSDPVDATEVWLIVANSTISDIFCRDLLDSFHANPRGTIHVWHTVSLKPQCAWPYSTGRINAKMFAQYLRPTAESLTFICGPAAFEKVAVDSLIELQYDLERVFKL